MAKINFKAFANYIIPKTKTTAERVIVFLYYHSKILGESASPKELVSDFETAGLGVHNITRVRNILILDRRTKRQAGNDAWIITSDKYESVEAEYNLSEIFIKRKMLGGAAVKTMGSIRRDSFVDPKRFKELKALRIAGFDLSRLIRMSEELNDNYIRGNYISVIILIRAILDHIAPIFGYSKFTEVVNNLRQDKSTKACFRQLEDSSRKIADGYLHITIRNKEAMPTRTQVNFSHNIDLLLSEVVRLHK